MKCIGPIAAENSSQYIKNDSRMDSRVLPNKTALERSRLSFWKQNIEAVKCGLVVKENDAAGSGRLLISISLLT